MPKHRDFKVFLEVDGQPLEEFSGEQDAENERAYSCWVPSDAGKVFQVVIQSTMAGTPAYIALLSMDGTVTGSHLSDGRTERRVVGKRISATNIREFKFTELRMTDDENALQSPNDIGCIRVDISLIKILRHASNPLKDYPTTSFGNTDEPVHERAKKLGNHKVGLGDTVYSPALTGTQYVPFDPNHTGPYVTFKIFYRPLNILQALDLVPLLRTTKSNVVPAASSSSTSSPRKRKRKAPVEAPSAQPPVAVRQEASAEPQRRIATVKQEVENGIKVEEVYDSDEEKQIQAEIEERRRRLRLVRERKRPKREPTTESIATLRVDENGAIDLTLD